MITTTPRAIIESAYTMIGVLAQGQPMGAELSTPALAQLNSWIDRLGLQRQTIHAIARSEYTMTANVASYTIGVGATFNQARPIWIDNAAYLVPGATPDTEVVIAIDTDQSYQNNPQKDLTGPLPVRIYYSLTSPYGTLYPWPIPDQSVTLVLYTPTAVTQMTGLTTSYTLPPGYDFAFIYNLAMLLAPTNGRAIDPFIREQAIESLGDIKRANFRMADLGMDQGLWPTSAGVYDIYSDTP